MSVELNQLRLPGVYEITPKIHHDERGLFSEVWSASELARRGVVSEFVQDNHSISHRRGVLRGLHYQLEPFAQAKLVRVIRGSIFDVAVDIRPHSSSFGRWVSAELSAQNWKQLLVPAGYAHGFITLEAETEVIYKVSQPYSRAHERSIRFDDPDLAIAWPMDTANIQLSDKDRTAPLLVEAELPQQLEDAL